MKKNHLTNVEKKLGYEFSDPDLLEQALSHRSVGKVNNERLEFLGDSLLNFIIARELFDKFPEAKEGDLSRLRAKLVQGDTLAKIARELALGEDLILGQGEMKSGGHRRSSILADTVEAIIGAVFCDSGIEKCCDLVKGWFAERLETISLENTNKDAKTRLQEFLQERGKKLPEYEVIETLGEAHSREFLVECRLTEFSLSASASSSSKRQAEKQAAQKMLAILERKG